MDNNDNRIVIVMLNITETTRRVGWGDQAQIMGYYDFDKFRKTPKPNLDKFKTLMDNGGKTIIKWL